MPPSTATQVETLRLTVCDRVERDRRVGHQRPPGLEQQPLARAQLGVHGIDDRVHVLLDARRTAGRRCRRPPARRRGCRPANEPSVAIARTAARNGSSENSCEPMWKCRPTSTSVGLRTQPLDRLPGLGQREPELGVGLAGRDLGVGVAGHVGSDAQQHLLAAGGREPRRRSPSSRSSSCSESSTTWPDARLQSLAELDHRLGVAVHVGAPGVEPGRQRQAPARRRRPRRRPAPPRPEPGRRRCTETPWRRTGRRSRRGERRARPPARAPGRAGRPPRPRSTACRTPPPARPRRSRPARDGRAR